MDEQKQQQAPVEAPSKAEAVKGAITHADIEAFQAAFDADRKNALALNNVTQHGSRKCAAVRSAVVQNTHQYSVKIPNEGKVTNQKSSGRCWLFAALNCARLKIMKEKKLDAFELSQTYMFFWDKFEKAGYFLETVIDTLGCDVDDRTFAYLLKAPVNDGGQYDMFVALVAKHGLCPKDAMPETACSEASRELNWLVTNRLRTFACDLRTMHADGKDEAALRSAKSSMLAEIYRIMCIHLGVPPKSFDWSYRNKDKAFVRHVGMTPQQFAGDLFMQCDGGINFSNQVSLINDPRNEYYKLYTVDRLGSVVGGRPVRYINLPIDELKNHAVAQLKKGEPVWFGCDVGKFNVRSEGLMDVNAFDYDLLCGSKFTMSKADRLRYGESLMTHAMVFTGVDLDEATEAPRRWRVENSWGDKNGDKGYYAMTDAWFDQYMYQIVIDKTELPDKITAVLEQEPVVLPAWDPMGALA